MKLLKRGAFNRNTFETAYYLLDAETLEKTHYKCWHDIPASVTAGRRLTADHGYVIG